MNRLDEPYNYRELQYNLLAWRLSSKHLKMTTQFLTPTPLHMVPLSQCAAVAIATSVHPLAH